MADTTNTLTRPACSTCSDTGEDQAFGGACTDCNGGTAPTRAPYVETPDELAVGALADWLGEQTWSDFAQSLSRFYVAKGYLTPKQIAAGSSMRAKCEARNAERAAAAPAAPSAPARRRVEAPGMFRRSDGSIFKVQAARGSGNLYAKLLLDGGGFAYAAGAINSLGEDDRLSLDDAKAFGRETGICCCCGAELTNPDSIAAGIGPICAAKY